MLVSILQSFCSSWHENQKRKEFQCCKTNAFSQTFTHKTFHKALKHNNNYIIGLAKLHSNLIAI